MGFSQNNVRGIRDIRIATYNMVPLKPATVMHFKGN